MRRIKSAPANICNMVNRKISKKEENNIVPIVPLSIIPLDSKEYIIENTDNIVQKSKIQQKKEIILSKKQFTNTFSGIISDTYDETNKQITGIDNYYYQFMVEFINNFLETKFNWKNFENLIYSLIIRVIISDIYHEVIVKIKENINMHVIK